MARDFAMVLGLTPCITLVKEAYLVKFLEALPYLCYKGAACHRHYDMSWRPPAQLLNYLITVSLTPLCIIWPYVYIHKCPSVFACYLAAQPVDLVIVPP